jgi:outer membrane biosynthesis protein TonB
MKGRERRWRTGPLLASLLLHGAVVTAVAFAGAGDAPPPPKTKIYAVDIVSPPPNVLGAPLTEALSNQEPGPAAAPAPAAETPPAPEPEPPAPEPDPEPAPPKEEAPKEPAKAPEPRRTPPQRPPQPTPPRPAATNPRPSTSNRPATPATPEKNRPAATPEKNRPAATPRPGGSSTTGGTGSGPNRTRGDGTSTAPATGSNPQPNSPGGEGLNIHVEGEPCPVAGYCENVTRQVNRYFRAPPDNAGARGEVCFRIQRDGSVTDLQARVRGGGAAFRLAMMEAAEAAGSRRAFGTLPGAFDPQRWRWCVELTPR